MFNKIADAVTGSHHDQTGTSGSNTNARSSNPSMSGAAGASGLNPSGSQAGGVGSQYAGTNYSAADNGALKEGAQVRDTGMNSAARGSGATASSGLASDKYSSTNTASTLGHSTSSSLGSTTAGSGMATGAALGTGLGTGTAGHHTAAGIGSGSRSNLSSSAGGSIGAQGREGMGMNDDAMTRSEEHLLVGKEKVNVGKAALHKYVTTEKVSTAVPIIRERAVVEREPITDANRDAAMRGPDFKEAHYEVNLHEERAIAEKEEVPIERVRLRKEAEQTQQYVEADLRKEHIELVDKTRGLATGASATGTGIGNSTDFGTGKTFDNSVGTGKTFDNSAAGTTADLSGSNLSGSRSDMKAGRRGTNAMDTRS